MDVSDLSRRGFLVGAGALTLGALVGCGGGGGSSTTPAPVEKTTYWRLSAGGRRISNAAKRNNAYKRFATLEAAKTGIAHPGDASFPVPLSISPAEWDRLFGSGRLVVDLRH